MWIQRLTLSRQRVLRCIAFLFVVLPAALGGANPPSRSSYVRLDARPRSAVYDPVRKRLYVTNPEWNRLDVLSMPPDAKIIHSIPIAGALGVELSADASTIFVGTNVEQMYVVDAASLAIVQQIPFPPLTTNRVSIDYRRAAPTMPVALRNDSVLVKTNASASFVQWFPKSGKILERDDTTIGIKAIARAGDYSKALIASGQKVTVYDSDTDSFSASKQFTLEVAFVAVNPTGSQFVVALWDGSFVVLDANLQQIVRLTGYSAASPPMFSRDGSLLYLAQIQSYPQYLLDHRTRD